MLLYLVAAAAITAQDVERVFDVDALEYERVVIYYTNPDAGYLNARTSKALRHEAEYVLTSTSPIFMSSILATLTGADRHCETLKTIYLAVDFDTPTGTRSFESDGKTIISINDNKCRAAPPGFIERFDIAK